MLDFLRVINPIICLLLNASVNIISFRYFSSVGLLKSVYLGFIIGLAGVVIIDVYVYTTTTQEYHLIYIMLTNLLIYAMLGYCYFHFVNLGETARRIRIIRELYDAQEGLSLEEILNRYNSRKMVELRINRLVNSGQIVDRQGRYYIGNSFVWIIARIIVAMKIIILGKRSEFD